MNIIWNGPVLDPSGYGSCSRNYIKSLQACGHKILIQPVEYYTGKTSDYIDKHDFYNFLDMKVPSGLLISDWVHVEHKTPGVLTKTGYKLNIGYTVWETDHIPDVFIPTVHSKDIIWTASKFSKQALCNSNINIPIYIIPHIIDVTKFDFSYTNENKPIKDYFVFLFNGEFTYRKGVDTLIKAYLKAFTKDDNVLLILKTYVLNNRQDSKYIHSKIYEWIKQVNPNNYPKIKIYTNIVLDSFMPKLYEMADVFVTATRGEGFGIPIAEAMASKNLVIAPDKGGHTDFCNYTNSILLNSYEQDIPESLIEEDRRVYLGQKWIDSSVDELVKVMQDVKNNYKNYVGLRYNARKKIMDYCDYKRIISLMEKSL